jgi:hypothetical protein
MGRSSCARRQCASGLDDAVERTDRLRDRRAGWDIEVPAGPDGARCKRERLSVMNSPEAAEAREAFIERLAGFAAHAVPPCGMEAGVESTIAHVRAMKRSQVKPTKMHTLTISDRDPATGLLAVTLRDLLRIIGDPARCSSWRLAGIEALGPSADDVHAASDAGAVLGGEDLLRIANGLDQIIDGYFRAYRGLESEPWLIVRAVDSTSWDVASESSATLDEIKRAYRNVTEVR